MCAAIYMVDMVDTQNGLIKLDGLQAFQLTEYAGQMFSLFKVEV